MTEKEILELLSKHEWKDVEFKEARKRFQVIKGMGQ